jgi:hypothetical protein
MRQQEIKRQLTFELQQEIQMSLLETQTQTVIHYCSWQKTLPGPIGTQGALLEELHANRSSPTKPRTSSSGFVSVNSSAAVSSLCKGATAGSRKI